MFQQVSAMWVFVGAVTALAAAADPGVPAEQMARARAALEASAKAYRETPALRDRLTYVVQAPGSEKEPKTLDYAFAGKQASVSDPLLQAVATDGKLYLTKSDVADRYVSTPYDGDFAAALNRIVGSEGSLFEPPPIAMHAGKDLEACIDALRFKVMGRLRIAGFARVQGLAGRPVDEIRFAADNGSSTLRIDAQTHYFAELSFEVRPPGAPEGFVIKIDGRFAPRRVTGADAVIGFEPGTRTAVAALTDLGSSRLPPGTPAPDFILTTLEGKRIALHELRGSVVVLDFWATWCVPCWKTLKETQAVADWAAAEHLPVVVLAVDTLEEAGSAPEKLARATAFWGSQRFRMTSLLDAEDTMFKAYGNPGLPSLVLVGADGKILAHHQGVFPEVVKTLQNEVRAVLPHL